MSALKTWMDGWIDVHRGGLVICLLDFPAVCSAMLFVATCFCSLY